ncbi:hypothetical protein BDP27DRAFT_281633 [Rhodocollybia butyracea]|uniref:SET domain-containing protein n=1 Tax=Rhodocollybia butyracea TaxID=206335 RepID=A0A9P5Q2M5_9AGAR|nr:hypothetical protein BDP27DRAFT_281633 [Rhodocollybia butyracea]
MWLGRDVEPPSRKGLEGCDCEGKCSKKTCKCWKKQIEYTGSYVPDGFMYDARGLLRAPGLPVFECNSLCNCGEECRNRVVAQGRKCKVMIKKTTKKGWGVFACERIRAGTFIGIYSGELLGHEESEERAVKYDAFGRTYLFDIDWWYIDNAMEKKEKAVAEAAAAAGISRIQTRPQGGGQTVTIATVNRVPTKMMVEAHPDASDADRKVERKQRKEKKEERVNRKDDSESDSDSDSDGERRKPSKYTIDAYHAGNFTRFLNHSCDPNAALTPVYIDVDDIERPLLTIFSKREISYGEEITFSYSGDLDTDEEEQQHTRSQPATPNNKRGPKSKKNVKPKHQSADSPKQDKKSKALVHVACQCGAAKCKGTIWRE